jgi:hypothetical protein
MHFLSPNSQAFVFSKIRHKRSALFAQYQDGAPTDAMRYARKEIFVKRTFSVLVLAIAAFAIGCGSSNHVSTPSSSAAPSQPDNLVATAGNAQVSLFWTSSPGATTYNI